MNQLLYLVKEIYIQELEDPTHEYNNLDVFNIIQHLLDNYIEMNNKVLHEIKRLFEEAPDATILINIYFTK